MAMKDLGDKPYFRLKQDEISDLMDEDWIQFTCEGRYQVKAPVSLFRNRFRDSVSWNDKSRRDHSYSAAPRQRPSSTNGLSFNGLSSSAFASWFRKDPVLAGHGDAVRRPLRRPGRPAANLRGRHHAPVAHLAWRSRWCPRA
ncbi:hypothetical protein [Corallococcus interemptor]|uniref:hypothetical protein n=1 Tax=Corallococcus interemptor TaxID=2316720 RepID=UPI0011C45495|nr:hypothetical protein [Corallococcus interemptor]